MPCIAPSNPVVTLVNVFRLHDRTDQQRLVELLVEATKATIWRSQSDFEAMLHNPEAQAHMRRAAQVAQVEPHLYEVVYSDAGDGASPR